MPKIDHNVKRTPEIDQNIKSNEDITSEQNIIDKNTGFNKRMTVAELFIKESEKTKEQGAEVTEAINKFDKMDLYKSIFLSDSEEEEADSEDKKTNSEVTDFIDVPKNIERNTSPPRGIFANIDFDELNSWRRRDNDTKILEDSSKADNPTKPKDEVNEDEAMYGPKIPENLQKRLQSEVQNNIAKETIEIDSSSSEDSWVDMNEIKNKKQKKKKSKKHKSKHKKKSKSKKKDK